MTELFCRRGDPFRRPIAFTLDVGDDLAGCVVWFTIKRNWRDLDSAALLQSKSSGPSPEITITDASHAYLDIPAARTATLPPGTWRFDVQLVLPNGEPWTTDEGTIVVAADITRSTT